MPIVFVHGVNVRKNSAYAKREAQRNGFLRRYLLPQLFRNPKAVAILNPYWGNLASNPRWQNASLPSKSDTESLGLIDEDIETIERAEVADLLAEVDLPIPQEADTTVTLLAKERSLGEAVDLLLAVTSPEEEEAAQLAPFSQALFEYVTQNPRPSWLAQVTHDRQLIEKLESELEAWLATHPSPDLTSANGDDLVEGGLAETDDAVESLGFTGSIWDAVREGGSRLAGVAGDATSGVALAFTRKPAHQAVTGFLGDILVYLNEREDDNARPGEIVKVITDALITAVNSKTAEDDKVIIIAHSMGGNIVYDILSHFQPQLACDVLITVGSQPGFFEELKQFKTSDNSIPNPNQPRVRKLDNVAAWINIFDGNDILSFTTEKIFEGSKDFSYNTGSSLLTAHTTYFKRPSFYRRLGNRVKEALA